MKIIYEVPDNAEISATSYTLPTGFVYGEVGAQSLTVAEVRIPEDPSTYYLVTPVGEFENASPWLVLGADVTPQDILAHYIAEITASSL